MTDSVLPPLTTPTLYHQAFWSSSRPYVIIEELGPSCPVSIVAITSAQLKTHPTLTAINPQRRLPLFHDSATATTLTESGGLCEYILEKYDTSNALQPAVGSPERATYLQLFHFGPATLYHICVPMLFYGKMRSVDVPKTTEEEYKRREAQWHDVAVPTLLAALKRHGGPWLCGEKYTAADAIISYDVMTICYCDDKSLLDKYPDLKTWFERVKGRNSFGTVYPSPC